MLQYRLLDGPNKRIRKKNNHLAKKLNAWVNAIFYLEGIGDAVSIVVHGVDAPLIARHYVRGVADPEQQKANGWLLI